MAKPFFAATATGYDVPALLGEWIDSDPYPRVILDMNHYIIWQNAASRAFVESGDGIEQRGDIFAFVDKACDQGLTQMMLSSVVSGNSGTVSDLDRSTRYALVDQRLSSPDKALVCGISYRRVDQMRYADLKSIFILTKAEDKILRQLLQGMVADHIAEENATSLDTVRSHIRSIYSKLGVSSREALFNRVSLYRIP